MEPASVAADADQVTSPPPTKQVRGEAATDRILNATHEILMQGGYGATTIDAVAERAGVARATIYRRWPSKQALVADAARLGLTPYLEIPDLGSFREEVRLYLLNRLGWFVSGQATRGIEGLMAAVAEDPTLSERIASGTVRFTYSLEAIIKRGQARGEVRENVNVEVLIAMIPGPLVFSNVFNRVVPDTDFVDAVVDLIVPAAAPPTT